jgi:hypothetical protein
MGHHKNARNLTPLNLTGRQAGDFPHQANLNDIFQLQSPLYQIIKFAFSAFSTLRRSCPPRDTIGMPRYWATIWSTLSTAQLADSTHIKKLRCIECLRLAKLCGLLQPALSSASPTQASSFSNIDLC